MKTKQLFLTAEHYCSISHSGLPEINCTYSSVLIDKLIMKTPCALHFYYKHLRKFNNRTRIQLKVSGCSYFMLMQLVSVVCTPFQMEHYQFRSSC